jgi:hypothetical protein
MQTLRLRDLLVDYTIQSALSLVWEGRVSFLPLLHEPETPRWPHAFYDTLA